MGFGSFRGRGGGGEVGAVAAKRRVSGRGCRLLIRALDKIEHVQQ